jgi:antitoxin (DNA-binding transcriptional repressor) of toxin-antitoxin stability system
LTRTSSPSASRAAMKSRRDLKAIRPYVTGQPQPLGWGMARLDLDDLPPRIAKALTGLADGEEVLLVQAGAVVARLTASITADVRVGADATPDVEMQEVLEHFQSIIDDEF